MQVSQRCLDIIEEFEGIRLSAYEDVAGVWTIGYGTTMYPNGVKVRFGDSISMAEAESFLRFDCEAVGDRVSKQLANVRLTQNQYDALISLVYNIGVGAFLGSTLFEKLKTLDMAGAAEQFRVWNRATVHGVKIEIRGLTSRRLKEKALFESPSPGAAPAAIALSIQERVTSAKAFRDGASNLIAGLDPVGTVLDLLVLRDSMPDTFAGALKLFPNLKTFDLAGPGDALPIGPRTSFSGLERPGAGVPATPKLVRSPLLIGMDDDDHDGGDIRNLQSRLSELGYLRDEVDGIFGPLTDQAVRDFQSNHFGAAQADGRVGPLTWNRLWGEKEGMPRDVIAIPHQNYLTLTRSDVKDRYGCCVLNLSYFKGGVFVASLEVCSGQPRKQIFQTAGKSPCGSMEPIPEGEWKIGDMRWVAGKDIFNAGVWNQGLGPVVIPLDYVGPGTTSRRDIEMHIDWNKARVPGTAGCVGLRSIADFKILAGWLRETDPRRLLIDWKLGTCPAA